MKEEWLGKGMTGGRGDISWCTIYTLQVVQLSVGTGWQQTQSQ